MFLFGGALFRGQRGLDGQGLQLSALLLSLFCLVVSSLFLHVFLLFFCFFCCYDCSSMFVAPVLALLLINGLADSSALLPMLALPSHYN